MAFSLYASTGSITTQLNDGAPFLLEHAEGLSGAPAVRYEQRGPLQDGASDLGYSLGARTITLSLLFHATTDSLLDTYRQTLVNAFNPVPELSTFLSVQRDDGEIRTINCHVVDEIEINLVPEEKAAHLHRAIVKLRAANPLWRANTVTVGTANYNDLLSNWWLAGGHIDISQVKGTAVLPSAGQSWGLSAGLTGNWAIAVVTKELGSPPDANSQHVWDDNGSASFRRLAGTTTYAFNNATNGGAGYAWPGSTADSYHAIGVIDNSSFWYYWNGSTAVLYQTVAGDTNLSSTGIWRKQVTGDVFTQWGWDLEKAMIWSDATTTEMEVLGGFMMGRPPSSITIVNDGDVNAYPVITLSGPVTDPVIVNTTTGGTIDLTGITLQSTDILTIDLRDGNKQIYNQNGANYAGSLTTTAAVNLAGFYLAPAPTASGGTNTITMVLGTAGTTTLLRVEITNRYLSF